MLKLPQAGRVKTRLGRDIGALRAAWWFRHQTARLIRDLSPDRRWQTVLGVTPDMAGLGSPIWPNNIARMGQGRGDLGQRMARLLAANRRGPTVLIGGDIPGIRRHHIAGAFRELGDHNTVFGPASDGGFWLVGCKHARHIPAFKGVRWSTRFALSDTLNMQPSGSYALIETLSDVDCAADL